MDLTSSTAKLHSQSVNDFPTAVPTYGVGWRHVQALLLFTGYVAVFFLRVSMSVAIVPMTDRNSSNPDFHEFDWSPKERSAILSAFFWGYLVMQLPAGFLGLHFSPKLLMIGSTAVSGVVMLVTPWAAFSGGVPLLCALGAATGICQGFMVPLTVSLISKWAPPTERNRFLGYSFNGSVVGLMLGLPVFGFLASGSGGWPSIFYFSSILAFSWSLLFWVFGADCPADLKWISPEERLYIETSLSQTEKKEKMSVPWKHIVRSVPFWALVLTHVGYGWGYAIVLTQTPSYFSEVLHLDISTNGLAAAIPYLATGILTFPVCYLADYIKRENILPDCVVRKGWTFIAIAGSAIPLVIIGHVGSNATAVISLLTLNVALQAFMFSGFLCNNLDLSPNYAGLLMGITNGMENVSTILAPLTVGWIVTDLSDVTQWRIAFYITFFASALPAVVFVLFGSTDRQYWDNPENLPENSKPAGIESQNGDQTAKF